MTEQLTKICSKCKEPKPLSAFYRQQECAYGVSPECKECRRAYKRQHYHRHATRLKAYGRRYYQEHQGMVSQKFKRYRKQHSEKFKAYQREYRARILEKVIQFLRIIDTTTTLDEIVEIVGVPRTEANHALRKVSDRLREKVLS